MNEEQYEQMLRTRVVQSDETRRAIKDQFDEIQEKCTASSMQENYIFQLLCEHIKATEQYMVDKDDIISMLKFVFFRHGILRISIMDKPMHHVLLIYQKPQEWSLALRQYGIREIRLVAGYPIIYRANNHTND